MLFRWTALGLSVLTTVAAIVTYAKPLHLFSSFDDAEVKGVLYTSEEGRYRVLFPDRPVYKEETLAGMKVRETSFTRRGEAFWIVYGDVAGADRLSEAELTGKVDLFRDALLASLNATADRESSIFLDNRHPGREVCGKLSKGGWLRERLYVVKGRAYALVVSGPTEFVNAAEAEAFLSSFRVAR